MGSPYSCGGPIGISPTLTLYNCGKKYPTYSDLCVYSDYLVSNMISLPITLERFVGLNVPFEDDAESKLDIEDWIRRPLESWPRDDAEAKLIALAIATYNFNNYEVPKRYHEKHKGQPRVGPDFMVHDPMFLAGMVWQGTRPSFYKLSIGSDLVKAVRAGKYPHTPTRVYRYTPVFPEEPEGGMDKLWMNAMKPLANRRVVVQCLEAFKIFLGVKRFGMPRSVCRG
ncbi:hypothetical protein PILCRDRAFT_1697 [Piloderma croceum F 1598]|uniref:Uncharacterized protein n=1 Tax=Piloderma croceum (strain F 1598) TaxID=765440 RepID=A0A0C3GIC0_PILCF|nr:hypothetical protein PILCRDRAFT_1697 [Piloderma croceum F 1598]